MPEPPEQEYEELQAPVAEDIIFSAALSCFSPKNNDDDAANAPKAASLFRNSLLSICKWFLVKTLYCRFSKHVRAKLQIIWVIPTARATKTALNVAGAGSESRAGTKNGPKCGPDGGGRQGREQKRPQTWPGQGQKAGHEKLRNLTPQAYNIYIFKYTVILTSIHLNSFS